MSCGRPYVLNSLGAEADVDHDGRKSAFVRTRDARHAHTAACFRCKCKIIMIIELRMTENEDDVIRT